MEAGAPKATPQTHRLGGSCGKKNGEVNSPTPGNRCGGGPRLSRESVGRLFLQPNWTPPSLSRQIPCRPLPRAIAVWLSLLRGSYSLINPPPYPGPSDLLVPT